MCKAFGTTLRIWYAICRVLVSLMLSYQKAVKYSPPVIPNMIKMLRPAIANHMNPKKAVIILDWLYTAFTRKKNSSEVAGTAISKNMPSIYLRNAQLAIGATIMLCQSVNCTDM